MPLLTSLLLLIVAARLLGQMSERFGQPSIVGEMLAGVLLGPTAFNFVQASPALSGISELAVFLIVLAAGLEMNFQDVASAFRGRAIYVGFLGFLIPFISGIVLGVAFQMDVMRTIFLGLTVSITALPVAIRILDGFGILKSDIAKYSIGAAIFSDIAALLVLGVILGLPEEKTYAAVAQSVSITGGKLLFLGAFILAVNFALHKVKLSRIRIELIPERIIKAFGNEALFGVVVLFVLVFGSVSETLGFHFVIGAFFGAVLIDKEFFFKSRFSELENTINSITGGFLAPVFFAHLGLEFKIGSLTDPIFIVSLLIVAVLSKIFAGWLGGRLAKMSEIDSLGIGIIMNGRGVMGLVITSIAYEKGFIGESMFATLILMSLATTILAPLLFRKYISPKLAKAQT
jgi:Kef-type K+ transport system membrane component KefB